jgi:hypothetical protein
MTSIVLPGLPKAAKFIRSERCEFCRWAEREPNPKPVYSCHKNPPGVSILATPRGPMPFAAFPLVEATHWCGAYQSKLNGGAEDVSE